MSRGGWGGRTEEAGMSGEVREGRYDKPARVEATVARGKWSHLFLFRFSVF